MKKIKVNVSGFHGPKKRALCPMCIARLEEVPIVWDEKNQVYKCNVCLYTVPRHMDPINSTVLEAGNEESALKPYVKSLMMNKRNEPKNIVKDYYDSPAEAWNSDDV